LEKKITIGLFENLNKLRGPS